MRTPKQLAAWRRLSSNKRRILLSHLPDEMEREATALRDLRADMAHEYGPLQWDATVAVLAEPDEERGLITAERRSDNWYEATLDEVASELGIVKERARQIQEKAIRKLRRPGRIAILHELYFGEPYRDFRHEREIERAIELARTPDEAA